MVKDNSIPTDDINLQVENCKSALIETLNNRTRINSNFSSLENTRDDLICKRIENEKTIDKARSDISKLDSVLEKLIAVASEISIINKEQKSKFFDLRFENEEIDQRLSEIAKETRDNRLLLERSESLEKKYNEQIKELQDPK